MARMRSAAVTGGRGLATGVSLSALAVVCACATGCSWDWNKLDPALGTGSADVPVIPDGAPSDNGMSETDAGFDATAPDGVAPGSDVPTADATADTVTDAPMDAPTDAPMDVGMDVPADAAVDIPRESGTDGGTDGPADAADGRTGMCATGLRDCGGGRCGTCCVDLDCMGHQACGTDGTCAGCAAGYGDCDGNPANGCETALVTTDHCGACGTACMFANAAALCGAGRCVRGACMPGHGDCDGNPANGCETVLTGDARNCGMCGVACALAHATSMCTASACAVGMCASGYADCDRAAGNGCEANLAADMSNCGACGQVCRSPHATGACTSGVCGLGVCTSGFADCNRLPGDGCEVDLTSDAAHCGACTMPCAAGAHASATCTGGACGYTCQGRYADCDRVASNGCEVDTTTDAGNCGGCGFACLLPNAAAGCAAGACTVSRCTGGYGDCDRLPSNGCETNIASDAFNCGACGSVCSLPNATATCLGGGCAVATCATGFDDCDGLAANGCETTTQSDARNCGICGRSCASGQTCVIGRCTAPVSGYMVTAPPMAVTWIDACGAPGARRVLVRTSNMAFVEALPFPVTFWGGVNYDYFVSTDGHVGFGMLFYNYMARPTGGPYASFGSLPDVSVPAPAIYPIGADLTTRGGGVCLATVGLAPSRAFVIETVDAQFTGVTDSHLTFEVIAYEASTVLDVLYNTPWAGPAGVTTFNVPSDITVGLQDQQRAPLRAVSYTGPAVGAGTRIRFVPVP